MKLPNKVVSYNESIIAKFPLVLKNIINVDMTVMDLYHTVKKKMDVKEFIEVLDCLYLLDKIELNDRTEELHYVS